MNCHYYGIVSSAWISVLVFQIQQKRRSYHIGHLFIVKQGRFRLHCFQIDIVVSYNSALNGDMQFMCTKSHLNMDCTSIYEIVVMFFMGFGKRKQTLVQWHYIVVAKRHAQKWARHTDFDIKDFLGKEMSKTSSEKESNQLRFRPIITIISD